MPLSSRLFRHDAKLEECLISDPAHVTPGASGDHVLKIQKALSLVDDLDISAGELGRRCYGQSTAAAVLRFKRKRNIVNHAYQTQADNIVGKMTIAALDQEMLRWERQHPPGGACYKCSRG